MQIKPEMTTYMLTYMISTYIYYMIVAFESSMKFIINFHSTDNYLKAMQWLLH